MKLYWFGSPNPQKVRLAMQELGIAYDLAPVDLTKGEHHTPAFAQLNPNCRVPVLEDDGFTLWESNAIVAYLGEKERRLWPDDARGRGDALRWMFFEARHLSPPVSDRALIVRARLMRRQPDTAAVARADAELPQPLGIVEAHLGRSRWMMGDEFSLVDCCYAPVLYALALTRFDFSPYPSVAAYYERLKTRPSWTECEFEKFERAIAQMMQ